MAKCQQSCLSNCKSVNMIEESKCGAMCVNHCMTYERIALTNEQVKCVLACKYLSYDEKSVCEPLCKISGVMFEPIDERLLPVEVRAGGGEEEDGHGGGNKTEIVKKNVSNVCTGYGRELCYKICRLHHSEPIELCLCACCKCKF